MRRVFLIAVCSILGACGSSTDTSTTKPPKPPLANPFAIPASANPGAPNTDTSAASTEVGVGSFKAFFATSNKNTKVQPSQPGRAAVVSGQFDIWSDTEDEVRIVTADNKFLFKEDRTLIYVDPNGILPDSSETRYVIDDGQQESLVIRRSPDGGRYGYFLMGPVGAVSDTRVSFNYGWETPLANLPTGTAVYSSPIGGQLFTSDGRRIFGRPVSLTADFTGGTVSGDLFNNNGFSSPNNDWDLNAKVSITNMPISGTSIAANSGMTVTLVDSQDAITINSASVQNQDVIGSFIGGNADALNGSFSGNVDISQPVRGDSNFKFSGVFSGMKQ